MESPISLPTDNIYKFYALFGLLVFLLCSGLSLYVIHWSHKVDSRTEIELETINLTPNPTPLDITRKRALEQRFKTVSFDKYSATTVLDLLGGAAIVLAAYNFQRWQKGSWSSKSKR
ncbi:MAG TPA: hypothetical protein VNL17_11470 [Verrucomicrobiae bacterium]|nr:hypothetical protein [Verrucomicrobiae bacterium]